ncbi:hypothetical protein K491DRAFT_71892 [Lophiostoma macrostomum CBS 122681]|uniref:Uncharacterized protein n=1 Tax=Lophiostoma macrostomum CBS 122681 TaxID=1314788 RepID=A0A6A6SY51_9PLEO|nr:hypothetical protein K491DRAFT_71892 [Lophiostoma macrostomum CBS 122681]
MGVRPCTSARGSAASRITPHGHRTAPRTSRGRLIWRCLLPHADAARVAALILAPPPRPRVLRPVVLAVAVRWWRATHRAPSPRSALLRYASAALAGPRTRSSVLHKGDCRSSVAARLCPRAETHLDKLLWRSGKSSHQRHIRFWPRSHSGLPTTSFSARMTASDLNRQ